MYVLKFTFDIEKDLKHIPKKQQAVILDKIDQLALNPRPPRSKKLAGGTHFYRIRVGRYRVIYEIRDRELVIIIVQIDHRKDIYR